ncbi:hypothetical protein Q7P36_008305 [Cladosporium allicinum]
MCTGRPTGFRRRNFPPGYTEMLERQHSQLVSCVQELYQRAQKAGSWDEPLPENSNRYPSVHDILAALNLLEPKDDGSKDFETFNELVGSSQSDASVLNAANDSQDHHDSTPAQSESPSKPCEEAAFSSKGTLTPESYSSTSSRPPSSADQSMESSPIHSEQTTARPTISRMPFSQLLAEYTSPQTRLFATLSTAPSNRSFYNTPNVPVPFDTTTTSTTPSLSLNPQVIQPDYTPSYHQRPMIVSSDTLPFCHDWTKSGITIDHSDFSTVFRRLSQLDVGMGGGEGAGLVEGIM